MSKLTREEVLASIVPNSDQINAEDLITGPITVTIKGSRRGSKEQPWFIDLSDHDREFRPCKTCRRIIIATWTDDSDCWVGQQVTLFRDPDVVLKGVVVGGVRISHLSGREKPETFVLAESRNRKVETIVRPIPPSSEDQAYIDESKPLIANAASQEELANIGEMLKDKSAPVRSILRRIYVTRKKEIEQSASD